MNGLKMKLLFTPRALDGVLLKQSNLSVDGRPLLSLILCATYNG